MGAQLLQRHPSTRSLEKMLRFGDDGFVIRARGSGEETCVGRSRSEISESMPVVSDSTSKRPSEGREGLMDRYLLSQEIQPRISRDKGAGKTLRNCQTTY